MTTPEGRVKAQIKAYLTSLGAYQFWPVQTGYGSTTVDCLACIQGKFVAIEVKRPGGEMYATVRQRLVIKQVGEAKGLAFVTDSLERTKRMIEDHVLEVYQVSREDEQY